MQDEKILTEVGTNEWQVVVFMLGTQPFAINVDKTREILRWTGVRPVPKAHPAMRGITTIRGEVIPLIDLRAYLGIEPGVEEEQSKLIVAEFNRMKLGFVVDAVDRIYRDVAAILGEPGFREKDVVQKGYDLVASSPEAFAAYIVADRAARGRAVKLSGAKAE